MATKIEWTSDQLEYVKNNRNKNRKALLEDFNKKFCVNVNVSTLKAFMNRNGIYSDNNGRFKKGQESWNKDVKGEEYFKHYDKEKTKLRMDKMHNLNKTANIGDESIINGVPYVRIYAGTRMGSYKSKVRKRNYVWEQHNGKVQENHCIVHLDGNRMNCNIENLACIPKKYMGLLAKNQWFSKDGGITETAIKWCELYFALKEV